MRNHFAILLFHTVRPLSRSPPPPPTSGRKVWPRRTNRRAGSKLSLRTVIPGRVFWVGCTQDCGCSQRALSSRNTTAEETKIIPPPPFHSVASREMLYFLRRPLRFPPFARFSIFRPSPFSARATTRSFAFTPSRGRAFPGRGERRILEIEENKVK